MKIILVFVSTLDGKVTKWSDPRVKKWTSDADKSYFRKTMTDAKLVVMGSNTFNAEPIRPSKNTLLKVMTRRPYEYTKAEVSGRIEFTDESPSRLVEQFEKKGYEIMHVVGGPKIATSFLKARLVDELWLTIEPKIFGSGENLVSEEKFDIELRLISSEKVNDLGTLINKYEVLK